MQNGLGNKLDVDKYAILNKNGEPVFNYDQMKEIRIGLYESLDVDKYTILNKDGKPVYGSNQMEQIYNLAGKTPNL